MIVTHVINNIAHNQNDANTHYDYLDLEWYELNKKIIRKMTHDGSDIGIQLSADHAGLKDGDVLHQKDNNYIIVNVVPSECIVIDIHDIHEMARVCYEIGNRHAPLFFDALHSQQLLLPMDKPLLALLNKMGSHTSIAQKKLILPLGGASAHHDPHSHHHSHA